MSGARQTKNGAKWCFSKFDSRSFISKLFVKAVSILILFHSQSFPEV